MVTMPGNRPTTPPSTRAGCTGGATTTAAAGGVTIVFYDGPLSHDAGIRSRHFVEWRARRAGRGSARRCGSRRARMPRDRRRDIRPPPQVRGDRAIAYALAVEATATGSRPSACSPIWSPSTQLSMRSRSRESAWSCTHGVARWREDCGCHTGGGPGWNQRWRTPLREAFDRIRNHGAEVFERRGAEVLVDPWSARDEYVSVVLGATTVSDFAEPVREG